MSHGCDLLKKLIDSLPNGSMKNALIVVYNDHCGGGVVTPQDGGGPTTGPPPKP